MLNLVLILVAGAETKKKIIGVDVKNWELATGRMDSEQSKGEI